MVGQSFTTSGLGWRCECPLLTRYSRLKRVHCFCRFVAAADTPCQSLVIQRRYTFLAVCVRMDTLTPKVRLSLSLSLLLTRFKMTITRRPWDLSSRVAGTDGGPSSAAAPSDMASRCCPFSPEACQPTTTFEACDSPGPNSTLTAGVARSLSRRLSALKLSLKLVCCEFCCCGASWFGRRYSCFETAARKIIDDDNDTRERAERTAANGYPSFSNGGSLSAMLASQKGAVASVHDLRQINAGGEGATQWHATRERVRQRRRRGRQSPRMTPMPPPFSQHVPNVRLYCMYCMCTHTQTAMVCVCARKTMNTWLGISRIAC